MIKITVITILKVLKGKTQIFKSQNQIAVFNHNCRKLMRTKQIYIIIKLERNQMKDY